MRSQNHTHGLEMVANAYTLRDARDAKGTQRRGGRKGRRDVTPKKYTSGMSFALDIATLSKQLGKTHPLVSSPRRLLRCGGDAL